MHAVNCTQSKKNLRIDQNPFSTKHVLSFVCYIFIVYLKIIFVCLFYVCTFIKMYQNLWTQKNVSKSTMPSFKRILLYYNLSVPNYKNIYKWMCSYIGLVIVYYIKNNNVLHNYSYYLKEKNITYDFFINYCFLLLHLVNFFPKTCI